MDTGTIILILSFGIPALIVVGIIWWIKRDFTSLSKWAQENKRRHYAAEFRQYFAQSHCWQ